MDRIAVYPGTFDPITNGHLDVIERGVRVFDGLVVAVAESSAKKTLFTPKERIDMIEGVTAHLETVKVESFNSLLIDHMKQRGYKSVLRGLRVISDFENEFQMALTNRKLAPDIETVFLMTSENYAYMSSKLIKEIFMLKGRVDDFVPPLVIKKLEERLERNV